MAHPGADGPGYATHTLLELPTLLTVRDGVLTGIGAARLPCVLIADDLAAGRLAVWGYATGQVQELWALYSSG